MCQILFPFFVNIKSNMAFPLSTLSQPEYWIMKRFRIGNDILITWSVKKKGAPAELVGKDIKVYLSHEKGREVIAHKLINGNTIEILFEGLKQSVLGKYTITIDAREQTSRYLIQDKCNAFELVGRSCAEESEADYILDL